MILLTGASGYIGGRLLKVLEAEGLRVRCLSRNPAHLRDRVRAQTEVAQGDILDPTSLSLAMERVDTAFYLVHSMGSSADFEKADHAGAVHFARAASEAG